MEVLHRELPWKLAVSGAQVSRTGGAQVSRKRIGQIFCSKGPLTREDVHELMVCVECCSNRAAEELRRLRGICFAELKCGGVPLVVYLLHAADRVRSLAVVAPLMRASRPYSKQFIWIVSRNMRKWRASTQREVQQCAAMQPNKAIGFLFLLGMVAKHSHELDGVLGPKPPRTAREMHLATTRALQSPELSLKQKQRIILLLAQHSFLQPLTLLQEPRLVRPLGSSNNWYVAPASILDDVLSVLNQDDQSWELLLPALVSIPEELYPPTLPLSFIRALREARNRATQFDRIEEFAGACISLCYFDPSFQRYF